MKLKNISSKIVNVGSVVMMPGDERDFFRKRVRKRIRWRITRKIRLDVRKPRKRLMAAKRLPNKER